MTKSIFEQLAALMNSRGIIFSPALPCQTKKNSR